MRIAIVCYPTFGGSGVVATELGLELARRGHEIHFITYSQPVRLALLNPNVHYHEVNVPEYPLFHYQPYELALSSKLDLDMLYHASKDWDILSNTLSVNLESIVFLANEAMF